MIGGVLCTGQPFDIRMARPINGRMFDGLLNQSGKRHKVSPDLAEEVV